MNNIQGKLHMIVLLKGIGRKKSREENVLIRYRNIARNTKCSSEIKSYIESSAEYYRN